MASWILIFFGKGSTNLQYLPHFPQLHDGRREEICVGDLSGSGMIVAGCNDCCCLVIQQKVVLSTLKDLWPSPGSGC